MDSLLGINASAPLINIGTSGAITPTTGLLASELGLSTPGLFGSSSASTVVELSGEGQLLSAAVTFQNQLQLLQPGTAGSGGGRNFGTDFASLAAEVQSFVDAFNGLQNTITNITSTSSLLGANVTGAAGLTQSLNAQAQASFNNGNSALTSLSQLGITFEAPVLPGGSGSLSIDLSTLQSAFNTDATGAFSLLAQAANAFNNLTGGFVAQAGGSSSSLSALSQTSVGAELLANSLYAQAQANGNLSSLLTIESLTGVASMPQVLLAMNEYNLVSGLLG